MVRIDHVGVIFISCILSCEYSLLRVCIVQRSGSHPCSYSHYATLVTFLQYRYAPIDFVIYYTKLIKSHIMFNSMGSLKYRAPKRTVGAKVSSRLAIAVGHITS